MKRAPHQFYLLLAGLALLVTTSCGHDKSDPQFLHKPMRAIYHWKTTLSPTDAEMDFIEQHQVGRIYIHYFDVVLRDGVVQPEATLGFDRENYFTRLLLDSLEVVPTIYITTDAMNAIKEEPEYSIISADSIAEIYALKILTRIKAMNKHNRVANVHEVQLDCDWTANLASTYFELLSKLRTFLHQEGMALSVTIRLHQLKGSAPPADMGVLMLYNTGNLMAERTRNSILDIEDVKPYLKAVNSYAIPLDFAFPDFGWQVCFQDGKFVKLASPSDSTTHQYSVRHEQADITTIKQVKQLAEKSLSNSHGKSIIIYHLDEQFLNKFTSDEIETIYGTR